jgi:hypothetical protein
MMLAASSSSGPLVDVSGILRVIGLSVLFGGGAVLLVSLGVLCFAHAESADGTRRTTLRVGAALCALVVLGIVCFGLAVMMSKS